MFKNYLTVALRGLRKRKAYAFINISGLAVGMACCILILMLVRHEWSFDTFHEKADQIYRLVIEEDLTNGVTRYRTMQPPSMYEAIQDEFPGVRNLTRVVGSNLNLRLGDETFSERLFMVDSAFFNVFSFPLLAGDPHTALRDMSSMVISQSLALKYFGVSEEDVHEVLGREVTIPYQGTDYAFSITGIMEDMPDNSSLEIEVMVPFANYANIYVGGNDWGGRTSLYLELAETQDVAAFEAALVPFTQIQFAERLEIMRARNMLEAHADAMKLVLQPLRDIHLNPDIATRYEASAHDPLYSYILSGIAILVLFIACINFMTLSVGQSASRAREVGMRKVLGAHQRQLMKQFWGEAIFMSVLSLLLGLGLAVLALPLFNELTGQSLAFSDLLTVNSVLGLTGLVALVGLVAGGYPAIVLSGFRPAAVLKGHVQTRNSGILTRSLVVVQFALSIMLMVSTGIMQQQLDFLQNKDIGYEDELIVIINTNSVPDAEAPAVLERFKSALLPYEQVSNVVRVGYAFTQGGDRNSWEDANGNPRRAWSLGIDYGFVDMMDMELVEGRDFSREITTDATTGILVNQTLVREFNLENPVGTRLTGYLTSIFGEPPVILGVVEDFNFESLHSEVEPATLHMHPEHYQGMGAMFVKIQPSDVGGTLALLENTWNTLMPGQPYTYAFLDEEIASQYRNDERWGRIVLYSSLFAILIACMGIFGLATLAVSRRIKEIGIRKVLGASTPGLFLLISKTFIKLVGAAMLIAWPLAYFGMDAWLADFAFRIQMGPGVFVLAGLVALVIVLLTVSFHATRAATANPVKALRYE